MAASITTFSSPGFPPCIGQQKVKEQTNFYIQKKLFFIYNGHFVIEHFRTVFETIQNYTKIKSLYKVMASLRTDWPDSLQVRVVMARLHSEDGLSRPNRVVSGDGQSQDGPVMPHSHFEVRPNPLTFRVRIDYPDALTFRPEAD
jgi:hypothetical protein